MQLIWSGAIKKSIIHKDYTVVYYNTQVFYAFLIHNSMNIVIKEKNKSRVVPEIDCAFWNASQKQINY